MADAEIIDFSSREPLGARSSGASAGPKPEPSESRVEEPEETPKEAPSEPPTLNLASLLRGLVGRPRGLGGLSFPMRTLRHLAADPLRAATTVAEALGVDWQGGLEDALTFARARMTGDYAVDQFGFDPEFTKHVFLPLLRPLVQSWFRVDVRGAENLPMEGSALLVSNHAGTLPMDALVLTSVVYDEIGRHVRMLGADLIFSTPYSAWLARKIGTTLACQEDAERLLDCDHLVSVFPEGSRA